jgi:hypothetical protein
MPHHRTILALSLLAMIGCGGREERAAPSTPAPARAPVAAPASQPLTAGTRRALITQRLAERPLSDALRLRLVEAWVVGSDGFDQPAMDRLLGTIETSLDAVDQNRFNATRDLTGGRPAVAGSTIMGALISGMVTDGGGRRPIAIDCGGIRANGWVERAGTRANRMAVIITSLSVQEESGRDVTYQHADGLAYLMGPDGLEGLALQSVTDQRGNSWLGLRAGTLVTLILIRGIDQTLVTKDPPAAPAPAVESKAAPAGGKAPL